MATDYCCLRATFTRPEKKREKIREKGQPQMAVSLFKHKPRFQQHSLQTWRCSDHWRRCGTQQCIITATATNACLRPRYVFSWRMDLCLYGIAATFCGNSPFSPEPRRLCLLSPLSVCPHPAVSLAQVLAEEPDLRVPVTGVVDTLLASATTPIVS